MLTHTNLVATIKGNIDRRERSNVAADPKNRHCSFLPMAHLYERLVLLSNFLHGTQVVFCPIPEKLFEYYPLVKPTNVGMVPRVLNKVYDTIMAEVGKSRIKRFLIAQALHNEQPTIFSRLIFRKVRQLFGGEVFAMLTGSAPITPEVLHFFRIALDVPIVEAYGQTESTAAGTSTHLTDLSCGTVGSPSPVVEIKLIDVPGTNYRSNNNQGEVCIRGPSIFKGNSRRLLLLASIELFICQVILAMRRRPVKLLMRAVGCTPVMSENGWAAVHCVSSIGRNISSNWIKVNTSLLNVWKISMFVRAGLLKSLSMVYRLSQRSWPLPFPTKSSFAASWTRRNRCKNSVGMRSWKRRFTKICNDWRKRRNLNTTKRLAISIFILNRSLKRMVSSLQRWKLDEPPFDSTFKTTFNHSIHPAIESANRPTLSNSRNCKRRHQHETMIQYRTDF